MKLHCPHCGVKGSAEDSYIGRKVKCPKCQGVFEVLGDMPSEPPADAPFPATLSPLSTEIPSAVEQEEILDWDDIASEIDLQLAEATMGEEQEGSLQDGPAALDSLAEDFEKPVDDFDLMDEISPLDADDGESPAEWSDNDRAETAVAESSEEDMLDDGVELEPYGIDKEQCWQCGKEEGVGESFVAMDGRLYCLDCAPVENRQKSADPGHDQVYDQVYEQVPGEMFNAERPSGGDKELPDDSISGYDNEKSSGKTTFQVWAKVRAALAKWFGK